MWEMSPLSIFAIETEQKEQKEETRGTELIEVSFEQQNGHTEAHANGHAIGDTTPSGHANSIVTTNGHAVKIAPSEDELSDKLHEAYMKTHWCKEWVQTTSTTELLV